MKGLHNIQPSKSGARTKKRVGRGDGSGKGTYSGRGMKGQRSRSGGKSGITARAMRSYMMRIPKTRGFKSGKKQYVAVNIGDIQKALADKARVTPKDMRLKGLIASVNDRVKVLGSGSLSKKMTVVAHAFSQSAKEAIEKAGGTAEILVTKVSAPKKDRADKK